MKPANVYHKTEKGVDEIARRTFRLPQRLRTILIMVDGIKPAALLLQHAGQLGMNGESLLELEQSGFITLNPAAEPDVAKAAAMPSAAEVDQFLRAQEAMNQLILDKIGSIRGYGLMLKLQKAADVAGLRALWDELYAALSRKYAAEEADLLFKPVRDLLQ